MQMDVVLQPTTVAFGHVLVEEPGASAIGTGYFVDHPAPPHDTAHGANVWHNVNCSNLILGPPVDFFDHAFSIGGLPIGVSGTYTWPIHPLWMTDIDSTTHQLSGWTDQIHTLQSDGTMKVEKLGRTVTRHPNENCGE
jgi:hypothetical protein